MKTFDELWAEAQQKSAEYLASRTTPETRTDVKHNIHMMNVNENHYRWVHEQTPEKIVVCKICGILCTSNYSAPTGPYMQEHQVCFSHAFWEERAVRHQVEPSLVINGHVYGDGGESSDRSQFLGHGGHRFYLKQGDRVWTTNNLWSGGCIPEEFRERMPDNAEFLTKEQYEEAK